jgi:predicted flap endonuclease-1-like 5' DNA nuclease
MTRLILETSLLLLAAYFLGAWAGCLVKRSFFANAKPATDGARFEPASATARSGAVSPSMPVAPPVRRADPRPIALETIERTSPQAAENAANRFEQVLTKMPAADVAAQVPKPAPTPTPAAPPVNRVAPAVSPSPVPAAAPAVAPKPATVAAPAPATAITPAASAPVRSNLPVASAASGQASVAAPIAASAVTTAPAAIAIDDLTRIRAIDPSLRARLVQLGIGRYRDIAAWSPADVARISKALGFNGRIEQENWIEQAQILARGGETAYARRKDQGEATTSAPAPSINPPRPVAAQTPPVAAVAPAVIAAAKVATPATQPRVADLAAFAQTTRAPVAPAQVAQAVPQPPAKVAAPVASAPQGATETLRAGEPGLAGAAASAAAAGLGNLSTTRDNLQRIGGINAEVEKLLNTQSVMRYAQVASWTAADAMRFDRLLGQEGRVKRENWIEQAQILSRGGDTAYSRQFDQRFALASSGAVADVARPSRLSDAIRDTAAKVSAEPAIATQRADMAGLRSVRSEAYAGAGQIGGAKSAQVDDLKRVRGVGVLIEKKLNSMGVTSYQQIANWSASDIDRVSQVLDFRGRIERENWVEQARILSAGGQTEFSRRVDRGEVETSKNR